MKLLGQLIYPKLTFCSGLLTAWNSAHCQHGYYSPPSEHKHSKHTQNITQGYLSQLSGIFLIKHVNDSEGAFGNLKAPNEPALCAAHPHPPHCQSLKTLLFLTPHCFGCTSERAGLRQRRSPITGLGSKSWEARLRKRENIKRIGMEGRARVPSHTHTKVKWDRYPRRAVVVAAVDGVFALSQEKEFSET